MGRRNVMRIEVLTNTEFELGDTAADTQEGGERTDREGGGGGRETTEGGSQEGRHPIVTE